MCKSSIALAFAATAMLAACASSGGTSSVGAPARDFRASEDCMFARTLRDWRPLDNQNLILFANGRTPYHVELARPAFGLDFDVMIGVYDRDGRICPYGGDAIIVDGGMPDRIAIRNMKRLTDQQLETLYFEYGIRPPPVVDTLEELPPEVAAD